MKKKQDIAELTSRLLVAVGEDPLRQGLLKTPKRVKASYNYLTAGYRMKVKDILNKAIFNEEYD